MEFDSPKGATPLDPDELEGLKLPHIQTQDELDQVEHANVQEGLKWLSRQRKYKDFLNEGFVKKLHEHLLGQVWGWAGQFRQTEKNIGVDPLFISVQLRDLLDDARVWIEKRTYSREEFAARFHHRLVKIHPFPNGNGRHARIMTDVLLENMMGVAPINWGGNLLVADGEHRRTYIAALQAADQHDYQPLIDFVSQ